jgi:hypothetical protein
MLLAGAAAAAGLAGCGGGTLDGVKPGPMKLGDRHQLVLTRQWADVSPILAQRFKKVRVLSIDGPLLNRVYVARGLEKGEGLIKRASKEQPVPTFHPDMSPTELVEFTADSIAAVDYMRVETSGLRPARFGKADGLRIDIKAQTKSGLEIRGLAELAVIKDRLYLILYLAPAEHYYAASLADVEAILSSAT